MYLKVLEIRDIQIQEGLELNSKVAKAFHDYEAFGEDEI